MLNNNNNIVNINKLSQILSTEYTEYTLYKFNDLYINVCRVKNDIYGNPLYHIKFYNKYMKNITKDFKGRTGRYYKKQEYITVQSYDLSNTIKYILNIEE